MNNELPYNYQTESTHNYYLVQTHITNGNDIDPRGTQVYESEIHRAKDHREAAHLHDAFTWDADHAEIIPHLKGIYLGDCEKHGGAVRVFWLGGANNDYMVSFVVTRIVL